MFTYKDSLFYQVKTDDVYEDSYEDKSLFDFSDYPKEPKIFDPVIKKLIWKIEDKFKEEIISEFVGVKSKIYSFVNENGE